MITSLISSLINTPLRGEVTIPGDKSISHRSLIFSSLANGISNISGLLEGEDVLKTAEALRKMGARIRQVEAGKWQVNGIGYCGLQESDDILDMGNSGTSTRLLMGLVAPFDFKSTFTGDASLRKRPMKRVFDPIGEIGAEVICRGNNLLPATIVGTDQPLPITYEMKMASAQVKSAIMLAALNINGKTTIIEPEKCRDHTEIMMKYLGIDVKVEPLNNGNKITVSGCNDFDAKDFVVPADISSAAFMIVAALIVPGSKIRMHNIGVNPLRDGIVTTLKEMGGNIQLENERLVGGEKVADIVVKYSQLVGINVPASRAPSMIDEYPILSIAASYASGNTKMNGLAELKAKESNRLDAVASGLSLCGVETIVGDDSLEVIGGFKSQDNVAQIKTHLDHRIAMSFLVMGLGLKSGVKIDDSEPINTSFPNFVKIFSDFGVEFKK
ncbi:MAG: 3-phosphoshikimate 1-carboxyvinyltransferase [Rickettsiales bacterium]|jgi:3-phosphoshikimate 1-carboxyvinyltransferase